MIKKQTGNEQRRFHRIEFEMPVTLVTDTAQWTCRLLDISLKGALLERPANFQAKHGTPFTLIIALNDEVKIKMDVKLAHLREQQAGFSCELIDMDSVSHLRRIVELNLGATTLLNRELSALKKPVA